MNRQAAMARPQFRPGLGLCLVLALGAHAALLGAHGGGVWHSVAPVGALSVRMVNLVQNSVRPEIAVEPFVSSALAPLPALPAQRAVEQAVPLLSLGTPTTAVAVSEPDPVIVHWPDASVPPGGVSGRVRLQFDANHTVTEVSVPPDAMPRPYEYAVRAAFMDRQMTIPAGQPNAACVDVRFEPGVEPVWRWAGTASCAG